MGDGCKTLLIENHSGTSITLYVWDKIRWIFEHSKTISPETKTYLFRREKEFNYELVTGNNAKNNKIVETTMCKENTFLKIEDDLQTERLNLSDYPHDTRVHVRRFNMENETTINSEPDFYKVLRIDREKLYELAEHKRESLITCKYIQEVQRWLPDSNPDSGDAGISKDVREAYNVLKDSESRAEHNNRLDHDRYHSRLKSITFSECYSPEQRCSFRKRFGLLVLSIAMIFLGLTFTSLWWLWPEKPMPFILGIIGPSVCFGGIQGGFQTGKRESVVKGLKTKTYWKSFGIGLIAGLPAGVVTMQVIASCFGLHGVARGLIIGFSCGLFGSLAMSMDEIFVDERDLSTRQCVMRTVAGALGGAAGGCVGAAIPIYITDDLIGADIGSRICVKVFKVIAKSCTDKTAKCLFTFSESIIERNISPNYGSTDRLLISSRSCPTDISHETGDSLIRRGGYVRYISLGCWVSKMIVRFINFAKPKTHEVRGSGGSVDIPATATEIRVSFKVYRGKWCDLKKYDLASGGWIKPTCPHVFTYTQPVVRTFSMGGQLYFEKVLEETEGDYGCIQYNVSEGLWFSKMIVRFKNLTEEETKESRPGNSVDIPLTATDINVSFKVNRGKWCDLKQYDLFDKTWSQPTCPHRFHYDQCVVRAFTIGGGLYYEKVLKVTNGDYDANDGCVRYLCQGCWLSKMIVRFTFSEKEETHIVRGSGGSVDIPAHATDIKVSFKVNRGVWCDLKKYDRLEKKWTELREPHVFRYDKPEIRTFTIGGRLCHERVMSVTNGHYDTTGEM